MATILEYKTQLDNSSFKSKMKENVNATSQLDNSMVGLGKGIAAAFSIGAVMSFGKSVVDSLSKYEYFSASLKTLLRGDTELATALQGQLVQLAKTTPFSLEDVQAGTKSLLAYGFEAGKISDNLTMLGNVASGVGAPLNDITYLYGTLKTQGRAFGKDINQFTGRGIPIIKELAKQFKTTEANVKTLVEKGKVGFPEIEKAFKNMTAEGGQFFNMMGEQSKTVGGQISNMGDSWEQLKVSLGKSQTGIIAGTVNWANEMISEIGRTIEASNQMDEAFSKKKLSGPGFWETIGGSIGNTELRGQRNLVRELTGMSDFAAKNNTAEGINSQLSLLLKGKMKESKAFVSGEHDLFGTGKSSYAKEDYDKRMAIFEQFESKLRGSLKLLNNKTTADKELKDGDKDKGKPSKEAVARENLTINIDSIGKQMTINSVAGNIPAEEIQTIILNALQSAVFGAKYAGR